MLVSTCFGFIYKYDSETPKKIDVLTALPADEQFLRQYLASFSIENGKINADGWVCILGEDYKVRNIAFLIKNLDTNDYFKIKTISVQMPAVTKEMNDGYNYDNSGFITEGVVKKIPKGSYAPFFLFTASDLKQYIFEFDGRYSLAARHIDY